MRRLILLPALLLSAAIAAPTTRRLDEYAALQMDYAASQGRRQERIAERMAELLEDYPRLVLLSLAPNWRQGDYRYAVEHIAAACPEISRRRNSGYAVQIHAASAYFDDNSNYISLTFSRSAGAAEIPDRYIEQILSESLAVELSDGSRRRLHYRGDFRNADAAHSRDRDIYLQAGKRYQADFAVGKTIAAVQALICLPQSS